MIKYSKLLNECEKFEKLAVQIDVSDHHFELLGRWASVGRTIDSAITLIDNLSGYVDDSDPNGQDLLQDKLYITNELQEIKLALDAIHNSIKSKFFIR